MDALETFLKRHNAPASVQARYYELKRQRDGDDPDDAHLKYVQCEHCGREYRLGRWCTVCEVKRAD